MAAITWNDVEGLDAALSGVDADLQTVILARVEELSASFFGGVNNPKYKLARMLLAAHIGTPYAPAASGGGASGPVTSETEGGVSRSYAVTQVALTGSHSGTAHGRLFDDLLRSSPDQLGLTS